MPYGVAMRIFGALLIVFGILLCFTIIAAPFGFFLILVGVVCCAFGGRRRTIINNVVQISTTPGAAFQQANIADFDNARSRRAEPPPLESRPSRIIYSDNPRLIDATPVSNGASYDQGKWATLVRYDAEISKLVEVLQPYGQKYVDELAAAYLALNDKAYLPMIIDKIVASARHDAAAGRPH